MLVMLASLSQAQCVHPDTRQCNATVCGSAAPFQCQWADPHKVAGCNTEPWPPGTCDGVCFDVRLCEVEQCPPCNISSPVDTDGCSKCNADQRYFCSEGALAGVCQPTDVNFVNTTTCTKCCNAVNCHLCPPCSPEQCAGIGRECTEEVCLETGGCSSEHTWPTPECKSCCSTTNCPTHAPTPAPTPRPSNPWSNVHPGTNCNRTRLPDLSPSPKRTSIGGFDVERHRCRMEMNSDSCCGYVPRFNWVLSTCEHDPKKRTTPACLHHGANASAMDLNYVSAYQWDGSGWNQDTTATETFLDNISDWRIGGGWPNDWDLKYGPTTQKQGTDGVGPPAMMFVISARRFAWSAFYALNQLTVNRGPGGQVIKDNCWSSSSGEFDFIESPFWAGVTIPFDRLYFTTTADSGRCIPTAKNVPSRYRSECSDPSCCLPCGCPLDSVGDSPVCFGRRSDVGYEEMGCMRRNGTVPNGSIVFSVDGNNVSCANHSGALGGGADSSSYFVQPDAEGDVPMIYAAVIDRDGTSVYRWRADEEDVWPGLNEFWAAEHLAASRPTRVTFTTPCSSTEPCGIHQPACTDDCPLMEAGGVFGEYTAGGAWSVEAAKDGQNWWNLFNSTGQIDGRMASSKLPYWSPVPHFKPELPFYCNGSCGDLCFNESCSVNSTYMCTAGDGFMGCSDNPIMWPTSGKCGSCCNVSSCFFECDQCTAAEEAEFCGGCPAVVPYVCTNGSAAGGCGTNSTWGKSPTACHSCCRCGGGTSAPTQPTNPAPPTTMPLTWPPPQQDDAATSTTVVDPTTTFFACALLIIGILAAIGRQDRTQSK